MGLSEEQKAHVEKKRLVALELGRKRKREIHPQSQQHLQPSQEPSTKPATSGVQDTTTPQAAAKTTSLPQAVSAPKPPRSREHSREQQMLATKHEAVREHVVAQQLEHLRRELDRTNAELVRLRASLRAPPGQSGVGPSTETPREDEVHDAVEELKCRVCLDLVACAHVLACGHVFCFQCVHEHIFQRSADTKIPGCPMCRQNIIQLPRHVPCLDEIAGAMARRMGSAQDHCERLAGGLQTKADAGEGMQRAAAGLPGGASTATVQLPAEVAAAAAAACAAYEVAVRKAGGQVCRGKKTAGIFVDTAKKGVPCAECKAQIKRGETRVAVPKESSSAFKGFVIESDPYHLKCWALHGGMIRQQITASSIGGVQDISPDDRAYLGRFAWPEMEDIQALQD